MHIDLVNSNDLTYLCKRMSELSLHLCHLLQSHDCVTLPGFGAFLISSESAYYDKAKGLFMPPSRTLIFSPSLTHNDGILVRSYARRNALSFARARQAVDSDIASLRAELSAENSVCLPGIGTLTRGEQPASTPLFQPDADAFSMRTSWLPEIKIAEVQDVEDEEPVVLRPKQSPWTIMSRVAASVAVVLLLGFFATIPSSQSPDNVSNDYASLAPIASHQAAAQVEQCTAPDTLQLELSIAIPTEKTFRDIAQDPEGNNYLIVASLMSKSQAQRFIAHKGDPSLSILHSDGKYRVYAGRYATSTEAFHARAACSYKDAWVLVE